MQIGFQVSPSASIITTQTAAVLGGGGGGGGASDEHWDNVVLLILANGDDDGTVFTDLSDSPHTVQRFGTAVATSTDQKKEGSASLQFGSTVNSYLHIADHADFDFGTGDFTIEMWVYMQQSGAVANFLSKSQGNGVGWMFGMWANHLEWVWIDNNEGSTTVPKNEWVHVAISRNGTTGRMFINGTEDSGGSWTLDDAANGSAHEVRIGHHTALSGSGYNFYGFMDGIRVTKGVGRYTSNFTPPITFPTQ